MDTSLLNKCMLSQDTLHQRTVPIAMLHVVPQDQVLVPVLVLVLVPVLVLVLVQALNQTVDLNLTVAPTLIQEVNHLKANHQEVNQLVANNHNKLRVDRLNQQEVNSNQPGVNKLNKLRVDKLNQQEVNKLNKPRVDKLNQPEVNNNQLVDNNNKTQEASLTLDLIPNQRVIMQNRFNSKVISSSPEISELDSLIRNTTELSQ